METSTDYYELMGVDRAAQKEHIVRAFRKQTQQWHPAQFDDEATRNEARRTFSDLNAGLMVLMHPKLREIYDQLLAAEARSEAANTPKEQLEAKKQYTVQFRAAIDKVRKTEERGKADAHQHAADYEEFLQHIERFIATMMTAEAKGPAQAPVRKERPWLVKAAEAGCLGWLGFLMFALVPTLVGILVLPSGMAAIRRDMEKKRLDASMLIVGMVIWAVLIGGIGLLALFYNPFEFLAK